MLNKKRTAPAKLDLLRRISFLAGCSDRELDRIARMADDVTVPAGHVLMREGETGREVFLVVDGWATIVVGGTRVAVVGPGQFVGEMALLEHRPRTATVIANTEMHLLIVGPAEFGTFSRQSHIAAGMTETLARRLRDADAVIAGSSLVSR